MTPLETKIRRQIEMAGPMPVAEYWTHCLFDPQHGYYTTRQPIGAAGDFTTADTAVLQAQAAYSGQR